MARKKKGVKKTPFKTEGLSVETILNKSWNELAGMDKRDIQRALRTVSLAANKRIARLKQYAKKTSQGYVPKGSSHQVALDALNWVTNDGKKRNVFGVGKGKTRNQMLKELGRARQFWNMQSSTISGAVNLRREREKTLFGKTREQAARGIKTKRGKANLYKQYDKKLEDTWKAYHKFMELLGRDAHSYIEDSDRIQSYVGSLVVERDGLTEEEIDEIAAAAKEEKTRLYEERRQKAAEQLGTNFGKFRG